MDNGIFICAACAALFAKLTWLPVARICGLIINYGNKYESFNCKKATLLEKEKEKERKKRTAAPMTLCCHQASKQSTKECGDLVGTKATRHGNVILCVTKPSCKQKHYNALYLLGRVRSALGLKQVTEGKL